MIITYYGKQFFKVQQGEMVLAFNPVSKSSKLDINTKFGADIALVSADLPDFNGVEQLVYGDRSPFVVDGPGDYEIRDVFVKGVLSWVSFNNKKYVNTVYALTLDEIQIVFLGSFSGGEFEKGTQEFIEEPDILFVPIGGNGVLDPKGAAKMVASLSPKMVIPMDYDVNTLKSFLKEMGNEGVKPEDKITLKKKDLENKESQVVVFKPQG